MVSSCHSIFACLFFEMMIFIDLLLILDRRTRKKRQMSCPMFLYGFTIGSFVPLIIVYLMRPESLANLWEFFSTSLLFTMAWSDGVAHRFNLTTDLLTGSNRLLTKMYSCYTVESWYQICSWTIYLSFVLTLILFIVHQHQKSTSLFDESTERLDIVFYYFCIFLSAIIMIVCRVFIEHYLLGYIRVWTLIYLLWYLSSFILVCLRNR